MLFLIGNGAQADGKLKSASGMIAIGQSKADNNEPIAIGVKTEATGNNGTAVGGYAKTIKLLLVLHSIHKQLLMV